jgi:hypothetical protein
VVDHLLNAIAKRHAPDNDGASGSALGRRPCEVSLVETHRPGSGTRTSPCSAFERSPVDRRGCGGRNTHRRVGIQDHADKPDHGVIVAWRDSVNADGPNVISGRFRHRKWPASQNPNVKSRGLLAHTGRAMVICPHVLGASRGCGEHGRQSPPVSSPLPVNSRTHSRAITDKVKGLESTRRRTERPPRWNWNSPKMLYLGFLRKLYPPSRSR